MKNILTFLICLFISTIAFSQKMEKRKLVFDKNKPVYTVEASCGICQFKMEGGDCALAIKYEGKLYYVDGAGIDDFGNAHSKDGFCNAIRPAKVQGEVIGDKFHVTWLSLEKEK